MRQRTTQILSALAVVCLLGFAASPALAGPPPFTTTELIAGNNAPLVNGANLLLAVSTVPSGTLIKLEPGLYDLGGDQIVLPDFVDIEGSGRDITTIFSDLSIAATPTVIEVPALVNGEIREVTVAASANRATGITARSTELLITEVNLEIEGGDDAVGVLIDDADPRLDEVFVRILGSGGNGTGFRVQNNAGPVLFSCLTFISNVARNAYGILVDDSTPIIEGSILFTIFNGRNWGVFLTGDQTDAIVRNVRAVVQGNNTRGIQVQKLANAQIKESSFNAVGNGVTAGIYLDDGTAKATESTFQASFLIGPSLNVYGAFLNGSSNLDSNQSNYESTASAVTNNGTGQARFGASQLIGTVSGAGPGSLTCIFAYNGSYTARNNVCV